MKDFEKYLILLSILNDILKSINKKPIINLTDFVDIDRKDILKCNNLFEKYEDVILMYYKRSQIDYKRRYKTKNYLLALITKMCKCICFRVTHKTVNKVKDYKFSYKCLYSIVN